MDYHVFILSSDEVFARMLELEFRTLGLSVARGTALPHERTADVLLFDLDGGEVPERSCYRHMIGFTRNSALRQSGAARACDMLLMRPFEIRLLRREVLTYLELLPHLERNTEKHVEAKEKPQRPLALQGLTLLDGEHSIDLSPTEGRMMELLLAHRGDTVSREELSLVIGPSEANKIEVYICHLRKKLEGEAHLRRILTVRGEGYKLI